MRAVSGVGRLVARQMRGQRRRRRRRNHRRPLRPHRRVRYRAFFCLRFLDLFGATLLVLYTQKTADLHILFFSLLTSVISFDNVDLESWPLQMNHQASRVGKIKSYTRQLMRTKMNAKASSSLIAIVEEEEEAEYKSPTEEDESFKVMLLCGSDLLESFATPGVWILDQVSISLTMMLFFC
ncbi:unnamed protein product [Musa acuminata subsp. burmannicoides]